MWAAQPARDSAGVHARLAEETTSMFDVLQVLTVIFVIFVVFAMASALAHALGLPGMLRVAKDVYFAMQPIYYPVSRVHHRRYE
jgi:hypothetical protein